MSEEYNQSSYEADKLLQPDGSVKTRDGEEVLPPDEKRAEYYKLASPQADKLLKPDGSVKTRDTGSGGKGEKGDKGDKGEQGVAPYYKATSGGMTALATHLIAGTNPELKDGDLLVIDIQGNTNKSGNTTIRYNEENYNLITSRYFNTFVNCRDIPQYAVYLVQARINSTSGNTANPAFVIVDRELIPHTHGFISNNGTLNELKNDWNGCRLAIYNNQDSKLYAGSNLPLPVSMGGTGYNNLEDLAQALSAFM